MPEHLKREPVTHAPEHTCCPDCGGVLKQFGEDVSEQLEYVPESFKVIYSLIGSAKLNGLDPELYLRTVLGQIADHPSTASATCCPGTWPPRSSLSTKPPEIHQTPVLEVST